MELQDGSERKMGNTRIFEFSKRRKAKKSVFKFLKSIKNIAPRHHKDGDCFKVICLSNHEINIEIRNDWV